MPSTSQSIHRLIDLGGDLAIETIKAVEFGLDVMLFKQGSGGEDFTPRYRLDPENFDLFIRKSVTLKNKLRSFFKAQKDRVPYLIALHALRADELAEQLIVKEEWQRENDELTAILFAALFPIVMLGVGAAETEHRYSSSLRQDDSPITKQLRKSVFKVADDIDRTTQKMILEQIRVSLGLNETRDLTTQRINKILDNQKRAEMIAQTESVRYYATGREAVAQEIGLTRKEWESGPGACHICSGLHSQIVKMDKPFKYQGNEYWLPPSHPRCKCSIHYLP